MKLRDLRLSKLLTIQELSESAGISSSTVRAIETGRELPSIRTARKLVDALEAQPTDIDEVRQAVERASGQASSEE